MALTAAIITELPMRSAFPIVSRSRSLHQLFAFPKSSVHSLRRYISSSLRTSHTRSPNSSQRSARPKVDSQPEEPKYVNRDKGQKALETIVLRLRNLGIGSDDEDEDDDEVGDEPVTGEEGLGELLQRDWIRPDSFMAVERQGAGNDVGLPWQMEEPRKVRGSDGVVRKRTSKAPTLAELTIEDEELRRLRRMGMLLRERISVPKAGLTKEVMEKIHDKWRKEELVRLKFHEYLANDMKTAHEIVERRTGGLVLWQSGSVMMVYRGTNYKGPDSRTQSAEGEGESFFVPDVPSAEKSVVRDNDISSSTLEKTGVVMKSSVQQENLSEEEVEYNNLLDGLGPRFVEWWGTGVLPVNADLLPEKIPGYKTPFRLLPTGMRSRLTNAEMTNLRKTAKSLPCHFALGRNRNHQGLAAAIIKLWEKSLVAKIAVKRGIQNTNNKIMAEELKMLTGGTLLLRNKFYIVIYRGKDFVPPDVAAALSEREELTKQIQNVEEKVRIKVIEPVSSVQDGPALAGSLAEFYEAQARWGRDVTEKDREKMLEEASKSKTVRLVRRVEHKLALAQAKKHKAEKLLSKIEESVMPSGPDVDQETITEEERTMFRRVGLKMKSYMPLGIRGVFDGIIEQMHLHWKHRELVKLISKQKTLAFVEEMARLLEHESGGVLVTIERIPKGYMLLYYRGKNYKRPISMRPRNLLTKQKALKLSVAMQRHEGLSEHIAELERTIKQMNKEIGPVHESDIKSDDVWSSDENRTSHQASEFSESEDEDEDELAFSDDEEEGEEDDEEDDANWEDDEESESNAS